MNGASLAALMLLTFHAPAGWENRRDAARDEREKVYGVQLVKKGADIVLEYYAPGNALFDDSAAFIANNTFSATGAKTAVRDETLGARRAKAFTRDIGKKREEVWVVDDPKGGFHAFRLTSATGDFKKNRTAFLKVLKSLKFQ